MHFCIRTFRQLMCNVGEYTSHITFRISAVTKAVNILECVQIWFSMLHTDQQSIRCTLLALAFFFFQIFFERTISASVARFRISLPCIMYHFTHLGKRREKKARAHTHHLRKTNADHFRFRCRSNELESYETHKLVEVNCWLGNWMYRIDFYCKMINL